MARQEGLASSTAAVERSTGSCSYASCLVTEISSGLSSFAPWSTKAEGSISVPWKQGGLHRKCQNFVKLLGHNKSEGSEVRAELWTP